MKKFGKGKKDVSKGDLAEGNPRERVFDAGWRFFRGDAKGAEREAFDDHDWRRLDLPHDWSVEDLPDSQDVPIPCLSPVKGMWRLAFGDNPAWKEPGFVDIFWKEVELPCKWKEHGTLLENIHGWLRRRVPVPPDAAGRDMILDLGLIGDADETYVNGVLVGSSGSFPEGVKDFASAANAPRYYKIPGSLTASKDVVIAIRIFDKTGDGGVHALNLPPETPWKRIGPFDPFESEGGKNTGHFVGGIGWYRKTFAVPESDEGRVMRIVFDGSYMDTSVWVNGHFVGRHPYGYTPFSYDITPFLKTPGEGNVIAVRVCNLGANSRWYSGSGLYRHVKLMVTEPVHVALWGIAVSTLEVDKNSAKVKAAVTVENAGAVAVDLTAVIRIVSPGGVTVVESRKPCAVEAKADGKSTVVMDVPSPELWELGSPRLYRAEVALLKDGKTVDAASAEFGIRTVSVSPEKGFMLNGRTVKLKGGCVHHDNGPLGAVSVGRAEERRLETLKAAGYNAVRCSHNPPSTVFLEACDRLGVLVIDEAFDQWLQAKTPMDYHRFFNEWWRVDLEAMVRRDFNHPSVVIWSIGNEISEQYTPENYRTGWMLADHVRALDSSRPVTQASWVIPEIEEIKFKYLDIIGYNYCLPKYRRDHAFNPRGVYVATESFPNQSFEYWQAVEEMPWLAGDFVWTAWDYYGESGCGRVNLSGRPNTRGEWPWHVANCGDFDICGFPKPQSLCRQVIWGVSKIAMLVRQPLPEGVKEDVNLWGWSLEEPSWTWKGHEGEAMRVRVFADGELVKLFLNGKELDSKPVGKSSKRIAEFSVPYAPGELRAEVHAAGKKTADTVLRTAGVPARLRLAADRLSISASPDDLAYVTAEVVDAEGTLVPDKAVRVEFDLSGDGEIAAVGNGSPVEVDSMRQPRRGTWQGRCLAILRAKRAPGKITLTAKSAGLEGAKVEIQVATGVLPAKHAKHAKLVKALAD